mmetsp:Transcript_10058/g.17675  ORF Transcript_10058/g.17675 Transcript_10058/m.17675 type:complete len:312 (-) Transcript_10058:120-1055(-)|eukprot:CAMPEP_0184513096 /NCGR_PEP_ID=MMETSP0198_2-20121128/3245_1 /TAXON_ID=1112570 /ORGANISM="Thraustochytrium sp., Strain LLF1b" /LENGTH=311 /DNA_ID=CAMNT_0026903191 /DNA_START=71 /DNA_END=1006 /DNA_ORIENTATION=+
MDRISKLSRHLAQTDSNLGPTISAAPTSAGDANVAFKDEKDTVLYEVLDGHVALITLNRPTRLNALTQHMQVAYFDTLDRAEADPNVRVIVVTGAGQGFCAGAEVKMLEKVSDSSRPAPSSTETRSLAQIQPLEMSKPLIAAINGSTAGLGLVLALMADIRFCVANAKFTSAFAPRGLIAEHGLSWVLPRIVGISNAMDILLSARIFRGTEAKEMGMVTQIFPDQRELMREVLDYARNMARNSAPASLAEIKRQVYDDGSTTPKESSRVAHELLAKAFKHPDAKEGVDSYVQKRDPRWSGLAHGRIRDQKL